MNCDKCGKPVVKREDATWLNVEAGYMNGLGLLVYGNRHIRCSPSRAQYIVHPDFAPVIDPRPEFDKTLVPEDERREMTRRYTDAWLRLQKGEFPLVFNNWLRFKDACKFVA